MTRAPAALPPEGLTGLDPSWSRLVQVVDADGARRTWHLLDGAQAVRAATGADPVGTVLAVHGNPTWSYLWRGALAQAAQVGWRVVAVDQLDMGFSERTGTRRRLARRVDDLGRLTDALGLTGPDADGAPLVSLGHDWGGVISAGWAVAHRSALSGLVLLNTAVDHPSGEVIPLTLRLFTAPPVLRTATVTTPAFLLSTLATAQRPLPDDVRAAYLAPYRGAGRRGGIGAFVADVPAGADHPSRPALEEVSAGLAGLGASGDVPSLLLWGAADPVFQERYLRDLRARLPHGDVHRFEGAGHLVSEDADVAGVLTRWLAALPVGAGRAGGTGAPRHRRPAPVDAPPRTAGAAAPEPASRRPMGAAVAERAHEDAPAVVQLHPGRPPSTTTWRGLAARVDEVAAGLLEGGVRPGQRVSLLVPPGPDLTALFYACLRIGAVVVVADAGLGLRGLSRAVRGAAPDHVMAERRGLLAARALRWPGRRTAVGAVAGGRRTVEALGAAEHLDDVADRGRRALAAGRQLPPAPAQDAEAAVLFTSGSTGPAKGVVYLHRQLEGVRDVLAATYGVGPSAPFVAAFAPFALFAPSLGATSAVPETDVTKPSTLTAAALADAVAAIGAEIVFASPAALANVVATAAALSPAQRQELARVRTLLSAGAPVGVDLLLRVREVLPAATARTPYGMTEALPVTDVTLDELLAAGPGDGVLVGRPVPGAEVAIAPLDEEAVPSGALTDVPEVTGEVAVRAPHVKERYDQLWDVQRASARDPGWHRTGDVGHLDVEGRLWVEGRLAHVLTTAGGALTPVGPEQRVQQLDAVARAAVVGVGPVGAQQAVVVLEAAGGAGGGAAAPPGLAPLDLLDAVRAVAGVPVAAVLVVDRLPTDVRHRSKVDRTRVAAWAARVLAGEAPASTRP
ncbi:alpha/beta fold hydrolase [Quadrisphaera sp. DSM 44207]|uniref:alpha/beta fold hydrolase n=1 Tax=Quadrisphaera sp. DSM 44207 TaxID=1881057 RepID=UPI00088EF91A|nr:alpha/beta fold hydrolase [Quadrisphaera sp. DSM 44207]SDQ22516.1 Acyl-CoA synthetase (AMP-forming)/AMP-acid ligase II [Quadrisphaera sp. DSM 44207]